MTPRRRSSGLRSSILLRAPRSLNDPVICRFSSLKKIEFPVKAEKVWDLSHGVRSMRSPMRARAASMSARVTIASVSRFEDPRICG